MGKLEKRSAVRMRKTKVNRALIAAIQVAGLLSLAAVAPNTLHTLGKLGYLPQRKYQMKNTLSRMIRDGYVQLERRDKTTFVCLTDKGERFATLMHDGGVKPQKPGRWDGKWRIVAYDLKEPAKTLRGRVRKLLTSFGFIRLQNSVWVFPYDCEDLIFILKQDLRLGKNLLYIIADQIEYDAPLRAHFSLPSEK